MSSFFDRPILYSPYEYPNRHWELDNEGQPTERRLEHRQRAESISAISRAKKKKKKAQRRDLKNPNDWGVTLGTARLLHHRRHHQPSSTRPFYCQREDVETAIWLAEIAPADKHGKQFLEHIKTANYDAKPGLARMDLKLATGAGKTTVMAMVIALQIINAIRRPNSERTTRGFLVACPGIAITDRLRVLQPNDLDSYYESRELAPRDVQRAKIVITKYHAFKLRETLDLTKSALGARWTRERRTKGRLSE